MEQKVNKELLKQKYLEGLTPRELATFFKCNIANVYSHLKRLKIYKPKKSYEIRKYRIKEDFFDKIDTEEKAYILGLFFADGYNNTDKNLIEITLKESDLPVLNQIKECLGLDKDIKNYKKGYYTLSFNSLIISKRLSNLGCIKAKTFKIKFPSYLNDDLLRHFMRGYFDGDGSISLKKSSQINLTSTFDFVNSFQEILSKKLDIKNKKVQSCRKSFYILYKRKEDIFKILTFLYKDSKIYLERKHNLYLKYVSYYSDIIEKTD